MKFKMQIRVENDEGEEILLAESIEFERGKSALENLGLSLTESKELLRKTQHTMVQEQVRAFLKQSEICLHYRRKRLSKGTHRLIYRMLFGKMELDSPRLFYCRCELTEDSVKTKTFSPLAKALPERTSPELLYLESKFSAPSKPSRQKQLNRLRSVLSLSKFYRVQESYLVGSHLLGCFLTFVETFDN